MNETLNMLGIHWTKLIIQTVNFSIVLFVLWKLAYKPVFKILDARKAKIAEGIANAEKIKAQLAQTEVDRQKTLTEAGELANKIIADARAAVVRVTEVETQKAVAAAEQIVAKAREAAAQERAAMLAELKREVGRLVVQTTTTVTGKVLTADDQKRLAEETQKQLA
jgi:F-type H+-transporting ATPase subunit b